MLTEMGEREGGEQWNREQGIMNDECRMSNYEVEGEQLNREQGTMNNELVTQTQEGNFQL